ncbi:hypothetical protein HYG86_08660 [Alkalicella caledoniensis]|uniref:Uncharacterized protein n=1 Tax=Alkalicella caledoniensis TaxID=2731377 RepID=A0A7G9W829_ALKCA|nr:hypothetical protein [Alkalicella caledoniensis]QNO14841.1 hypothetical protein HYG86_08660 [Alkalicella caledoniensis]
MLIIRFLTLLIVVLTIVLSSEMKIKRSYGVACTGSTIQQALKSVRFQNDFPLILLINSVLVLLILIYKI